MSEEKPKTDKEPVVQKVKVSSVGGNIAKAIGAGTNPSPSGVLARTLKFDEENLPEITDEPDPEGMALSELLAHRYKVNNLDFPADVIHFYNQTVRRNRIGRRGDDNRVKQVIGAIKSIMQKIEQQKQRIESLFERV